MLVGRGSNFRHVFLRLPGDLRLGEKMELVSSDFNLSQESGMGKSRSCRWSARAPEWQRGGRRGGQDGHAGVRRGQPYRKAAAPSWEQR